MPIPHTLIGLALVLPLFVLVPASPAEAAPTRSVVITVTDVVDGDVWPAYDAGIDRFAIDPGDTPDGNVTVTASSSESTATVRVNGRPAQSGQPVTVTGLSVGDEVNVQISDSGGTTNQSYIYLPEDFPELQAISQGAGPSADHVFLGLSSFLNPTKFQAVVDERGVPVHAVASTAANDFKAGTNGPPYTVFDQPVASGGGGSTLVELDDQFREVATRQLTAVAGVVAPGDTDFHDVQFTDDGRIVMMGYHGSGGLVHAVIQITDLAGDEQFTWSSAGHIDPAEAYVAPNGDYAHINSAELQPNGDIVASFRNVSAILRIATTAHDGYVPGEVIWQLGGEENEFTITDAGYGGPCAQHDARILSNGNLQIFDNGSRKDTTGAIAPQTENMCPNPADPTGPRIARPQSRVVEYQLNTSVSPPTATRAWQHVPTGRYAPFAGNAQRLANGNVLTGWSLGHQPAAPPPNPGPQAPIATEVAPDQTELWSLKTNGWFSYRAFRFPAPDRISPTLTLHSDHDGQTYQEGQVVPVDFTCTDRGGTNLQTCGGELASGDSLDTSPGAHTLTLRATDGQGNVTTQAVNYTVLPWHQPDAQVRRKGVDWVGAGTYGSPDSQRVTIRERPLKAKVRVENDGLRRDRFTIKGRGPSRKVDVRYVADGQDVTGRVVAGTFRTPRLDPGEHWKMKVVLDPVGQLEKKFSARIKAISIENGTRKDGVTVTLRPPD